MKADNFRLEEYFARIRFDDVAAPNITTVTAIMEHQLRSVPFENLDVLSGKGVSLVPEAIVEKVVHRRRGGYCYEVNGLFAMALEALGVPYQFVAARPRTYPVRRPKTHMGIVVQTDGEQWLCDTGFGGHGIRQPIPLSRAGEEITQNGDRFRLGLLGEGQFLLEALVDGQWSPLYEFDLYQPEWIDFAPANHLNSTHPDALFVQKPVIVLFTENGRRVLFGNRLKLVEGDSMDVRSVAPEAFDSVLEEYFGLRTETGGTIATG